MQWDEEKLKETEKFRGTFDKIDEPKTPYRANSSVSLHALRVRNRKNRRRRLSSKWPWTNHYTVRR